MPDISKNIWKAFKFENEEKSALDYLNEQKTHLLSSSKGLLNLDIEAVDSYIESDPPKMAVLYKVFLVAPRLGNYRVKLFTVAEYYDKKRFPVDIFSHLDNDRINNVGESDFLEKISEIIFSKKIVEAKIQELYKLSLEVKDKSK